MTLTAEHRPATRRRRFAHDDLVAVDLFSGFGGLTRGIERAGFTTIMAANHNRYKVEVHPPHEPEASVRVLIAIGLDGATLAQIKELCGAGHGTTQALHALIAGGYVVQDGARYVRGAR